MLCPEPGIGGFRTAPAPVSYQQTIVCQYINQALTAYMVTHLFHGGLQKVQQLAPARPRTQRTHKNEQERTFYLMHFVHLHTFIPCLPADTQQTANIFHAEFGLECPELGNGMAEDFFLTEMPSSFSAGSIYGLAGQYLKP